MRMLVSLYSPPSGGTWGSLTRVLALGEAAKASGHEVAFCGAGELAERLSSLGHEVYPVPLPTFLGLPKRLSRLLEAKTGDVAPPVRPGKSFGSIWLVLFFTGVTGYRFLRRSVEAQLEAIDACKPDILFTEVDPAAFLVSRITGIPIASTFASVFHVGVGSLPYRRLRSSAARILREHGKPAAEPIDLFAGRQSLKIVPSIPELERELPKTDDVVFVGSLFSSIRTASDVEFRPEPGRRYVFAYVGTGSIRLNVLREVLPVLFPRGGDRVCLVGSQAIAREESVGNVIFRPFWDAHTVMPHCDWVICHGGHNTIIQSLVNGAPLIVFPGPVFERRFNAERVQASGAGRFGEIPDFNRLWLEAVMKSRDQCAPRAAELGKRILSLGGPSAAVAAMERWAGEPSLHR